MKTTTFHHLKLDKTLSWSENHHLNELIIENPIFLRELVTDLIDPADSVASIACGEKVYAPGKELDLIFNPLKLDFNNRRALATLLKMLVKTSVSEDFYLSTNRLKTKIVQYLDKIVDAENFIFEVDTDDFTLDAIAKSINIHIVSDDDDYIELLTDYMAMMAELAGAKLFIFLNLRMFITSDELTRFVHNLNNHQLDI